MHPETITRVPNRKGERGNVLAYTVMSAFFLFLAVGLCVDLSHLYLAKTELQNTADAAALAGASALKLAVPDRITISIDRAVQVMNANKYNFNNRTYAATMNTTLQRDQVEFSKNLGSGYEKFATMDATDQSRARFVRVTTPPVPINTFFAIPILGFSTTLSATATAGLSVPGNIGGCPLPITAVQCNPAVTSCNLCDPNDPLYPNCTFSKYWGNCGGTDPFAPQTRPEGSADDPDKNGVCDPKKEFCKGCTYNVRAGPQAGQGPSPGNFLVLGCAGSGAANVRQALAIYGNDCPCDLNVGNTTETQTGDLAGAVRQGLNVRFDVYSGGLHYGTDMPPDTNIEQGGSHGNGSNQWWDGISYSQYQGTSNPVIPPAPPSHAGVDDRRVIVVPIANFDTITDEGGHQNVTLGGMGGFFMRAQVSDGNGGDIQVEYIADDIISVIGFDPTDASVTNIVTPVLYR
jgi:Flp pilus assembly protein TadG